MSSHHHRILTPGASRKRKEREAFYPTKSLPSAQLSPKPALKANEESVSSNGLLAGYLAYEFLTKGTLLGQRFDPARAEAVPLAGGSIQSKRGKLGLKNENNKSYAEVASILKTNGVHIPGIVNPTQLARWIQQ